MHLFDNLTISLQTFISHPIRTLLTSLGLIIGVASLLIMIGLGEGTRLNIKQDIENLGGSELIFIQPTRIQPEHDVDSSYDKDELTIDDVGALKASMASIDQIAAVISTEKQIGCRNKSYRNSVFGVSPEYQTIRRWSTAQGRFIGTTDVESNLRVCVLGSEIKKKIFYDERALGKFIRIGMDTYTVVGTMAERESESTRWLNGLIFIPISTLDQRDGIDSYLSEIIVKADHTESVHHLLSQIERLIELRHAHPEKFEIHSQAEVIRAVYRASSLLRFGFGTIAAIIMLVGGIGISNLMLLSVSERTREIGIRKSVGALDSDILKQFLWEAMMISLVGGALGILIGLCGGEVVALMISHFLDNTVHNTVNIYVVIAAFSFAAVIGLLFGLYPALRASKLDVSQALNYE